MTKINALTYEQAAPQTQEIFDALKSKIGMVPNLYATIGHSPAALNAILGFGEALGGGELNAQEAEAIALAVGQENECGYCLSAHSAIGKMVGFSEEETLQLRQANIEDPKLNALTQLAQAIAATRGRPSQTLLDNFFNAGYSQGAFVELIGYVALNTFTNYFNHIAETDIDFPLAQGIEAKV